VTQEQDVTRLQEQVKSLFNAQEKLENNLEQHERDDKQTFAEVLKRMDEMHKSFQNRLPPWATAVIGILMAACGWLAKG